MYVTCGAPPHQLRLKHESYLTEPLDERQDLRDVGDNTGVKVIKDDTKRSFPAYVPLQEGSSTSRWNVVTLALQEAILTIYDRLKRDFFTSGSAAPWRFRNANPSNCSTPNLL